MKRWKRDLLAILMCGAVLLAYGLTYMSESVIAAGIAFVIISPFVAWQSNKAETIEDERDLELAGKASLTAMLAVVMASCVIGVIFLFDYERIGEWAKYSGYTLFAVAVALFAAMAISYVISNRRMIKEAPK